MLGGAFSDPTDSAMIVFNGDVTDEYIENFVKNDPYVVNNLVPSWKVRNLNTIVPNENAN